ncbi:hypothetical protein AGLY_002348 [Aphis glycines]|uniref:Uncharacterized protein n=1 Tax=Aphis glycines TaxID=307491 RepID=A0A6G0U356_APHGL|nr:hypothetical protein AGLY_002348 [Aphis glycines]
MDRVKTILKETIDVVNLFPSAQQSSTSNINDTEMKIIKKIEEADRLRIYRKYKNKYNYIDQIKPPLEDLVKKPVSQNNLLENVTITNVSYTVHNDLNDNTQNDQNDIVQNDLKVNTQNDPNNIVQNDLNGSFTRQDIENDRRVYELVNSKLENSPYDHSAFIIYNVNATHFTVKLPNGEDCMQPLRAFQHPVIVNKCDALFSKYLKYSFLFVFSFINIDKKFLAKSKYLKLNTKFFISTILLLAFAVQILTTIRYHEYLKIIFLSDNNSLLLVLTDAWLCTMWQCGLYQVP